MKIILVSGKARSGKSTLTNFLLKAFEEKNKKPLEIQVGQYIKYYAMKYFGWNGEEETKPRDLLIYLGTDIIRNKIDPNFHINRLVQDIEVLSYFYDAFIVSDVRFPVEIEKVKEKYGNDVMVIKIERESEELTESQKANITETALDDFNNYDMVIDNSGTLEDLQNKVPEIIQKAGE